MFVFSADWHLSQYTWGSRRSLQGDAYHSLRQITDYCLQHSLPHLAGGDLFDTTRPDSQSVQVMAGEMSRMANAKLPVFFVQGQHEKSSSPWMQVHAWPQHVHRSQFTIRGHGVRAYGLDWTSSDLIDQELAAIPEGTDVLLCHQVWSEHMGDVTRPECAFTQVPHARLILTGDYHHHAVTPVYTPDGAQVRAYALSPGEISLRATNREFAKYFFHVYKQDGRWQWDPVRLQTRPCFHARLETGEDLDRFISSTLATWFERAAEGHNRLLPAELRRPVFILQYKIGIPHALARLEHACSDAHLFAKAIRDDVETVDADVSRQAHAAVIQGGLAQALPRAVERELPGDDRRDDRRRIEAQVRCLLESDPADALRNLERDAVEGAHARHGT